MAATAARYAAVARHRNKKRAWVRALMDHCADCGNTDARVLEWDHTEPLRRKQANLRPDTPITLAGEGAGWKRIWAAIFKCEVRCANCHMIRHAEAS